MMGEDNLNLLYTITPYLRYKNFLLSAQENKCRECGKDLSSLKANMYALHHDPRLGDKGSKYIDFKRQTGNRIVCNNCHSKHRNKARNSNDKSIIKAKNQMTNILQPISKTNLSGFNEKTEDILVSLGYQPIKGKTWNKRDLIIHIEQLKSSNREYILIYWREIWKDDYAIIFDYSSANGPVCVVPIKGFFASEFVSNKRMEESYYNSLNWWSQRFPINHDLAQLVLSYKDRWDLLKN